MWTNRVEVCQRAQCTSTWTRGLLSLEEREEYLSTIVPKLLQDKISWQQYVYFEPIPEKLRYSLGGYSHREHWSCTR
jgi:hypothetical protein